MSDKVTPFLWFDGQAEEAANFYVSVFRNGRIIRTSRYSESSPGTPGSVMTVEFEIEGLRFVALNGGPEYRFTPAISFMIDCKDQAEVDYFWERLTEGGAPVQCGWLRDKYGVSWQVIPEALMRLLTDENETKADAVMQAMLKMTKIEVAGLEAAYAAA